MFIVRQSEHIQEDIKRNWSSWNYGQEGFEGTEDELNGCLENITDERPFWISGFEIYPDDIKNSEIKELYDGYWVLVDNTRGSGLSCNILDSETLEDSISIVTDKDFRIDLGEGETVDCSNAKVVWSDEENFIHILKIED